MRKIFNGTALYRETVKHLQKYIPNCWETGVYPHPCNKYTTGNASPVE
ncbi:MAG: hypothetical protein LBL04_14505 [Bacteroidales bacterium]|nr:hypothetical protein [Bacteroidales bacterium]